MDTVETENGTLILATTTVILLVIYLTRAPKVLESHGIKGPKPYPLIGNSVPIIKKGLVASMADWAKTYGNIYGMYIGTAPNVVVVDPDILKEVQIKDFHHFRNRRIFDLGQYPFNFSMLCLRDGQWKRIRSAVSSAFSTSKLKQMTSMIQSCAEDLVKRFEVLAKKKEDVAVKDYFSAFAIDVIGKTAYGIETDCQKKSISSFVTYGEMMTQGGWFASLGFFISSMFPRAKALLKAMGFKLVPPAALQYYVDAINQVIDHRKHEDPNTSTKRADLLQTLLENEFQNGELHNKEMKNNKGKGLNRDEIMGQAFFFFVAGYETTSSAMQYLAYVLATHPDVQQKVLDEIVSVLQNKLPNYENILELKYLDCVVKETLRMYPPVSHANREVGESVTVSGVHLPKGAAVMIPVYHLHHSPKYFPDPETFKPERFFNGADNKIHPFAYQPFGIGPRKCPGGRLSMLELKIVFVMLLTRFKFLKVDATPEKVEFKTGALLVAKTPIVLGIESRQTEV